MNAFDLIMNSSNKNKEPTMTNHIIVYDEDAINEIGRDAGLKMWNTLDSSSRDKLYENDDEKHYYIGNIIHSKGNMPPLIVYQMAGSYRYNTKCEYAINLLTGKPTKTSHIQVIPNIKLIRSICS
jgi:hypothetical protein